MLTFARALKTVTERYFRTMWRFMTLLPKRFVEEQLSSPARYAAPGGFLMWNVLLGAISGAWVTRIFRDYSHPEMFYSMAGGLFANALIVVFGAAGAWLVGAPVRFREMGVSFCYASAWMPLWVPASVTSLELVARGESNYWWVLALAGIPQGLYLSYLIGTMGRRIGLSGRAMASFAIITVVTTLLVMGGGGAWIYAEAEANSRETPIIWNSLPTDRPTLRVSNATRTPHCATCWSTEAEAIPGQMVSFDIYYHQPTDRIARDVKVKLHMPSIAEGVAVFGAEVWSSESPKRTFGTATLRVVATRAVKFKFADLEWYPDPLGPRRALLDSQEASSVFGGEGLRLGDVNSGWDHQGSIVVRFAVLDAEGQPPLSSPEAVAASPTCENGRPRVSLNWLPAPGATVYVVYRGRDFVARAFGTAWNDDEVVSGQTYSYAVGACDDDRCVDVSPRSIQVTAPSCEASHVREEPR